MKLLPKRALLATALAAAFVGLSATAIAQGMGGMSPELRAQHMAQRVQGVAPDAGTNPSSLSERHALRVERMQKFHAERQAKLKADLHLSAEQEAAWSAFVARTAPEPLPMKAATREDWSKLTTPERLDKMQALRAEREAAMNKRIDATKSFYAVLTPEQQKVFDAQGPGGFQRTGMKGGNRMGPGGHHGRGGMGCDAPMQPRS